MVECEKVITSMYKAINKTVAQWDSPGQNKGGNTEGVHNISGRVRGGGQVGPRRGGVGIREDTGLLCGRHLTRDSPLLLQSSLVLLKRLLPALVHLRALVMLGQSMLQDA